jgi:hypothetical protein
MNTQPYITDKNVQKRYFRQYLIRSNKIITPLVLSLACISVFPGCESAEDARALGTAIGAAVGGTAGYAIDRRHGNGVRGAVAGAGFGAALGNLIGGSKLFKARRLLFQEAVVRGDLSDARRYVQTKFVNDSIKGFPPIYYAAVRGDSSMARLLVRNGASVSLRVGGKSLAFTAAAYGHPETASTLIQLGGGTTADIRDGRARYVANAAFQRRQAAAANALALSFLVAALQSSSGPAGDDHNYCGTGLTRSQFDAACARGDIR